MASELHVETRCIECLNLSQAGLPCSAMANAHRKMTVDSSACRIKKRRPKRRFVFASADSVGLDAFYLNGQFDFRRKVRQAIGQTIIAAIESAGGICATDFFFEHGMHDAFE